MVLGTVALAGLPLPASATLLATATGAENTSAPPDDPGWDNVGLRSLLTAVYLGNRWVLTANHVGFGDVDFGGITYTAVPNSKVRIQNEDFTNADLQMFKIMQAPPLPPLEIRTTTPAMGSTVVLIGHGRNRGTPTTYMGLSGWEWGPGQTMRWGSNLVLNPSEFVLSTQSFSTRFDEIGGGGGISDEGQAVTGDSGGAVFQKVAGTWYLVGTLFAQELHPGQPAETTIYGNLTFAADLATYRDQIVAVASSPGCADGLDDDGDGLIDYPDDPGCTGPADLSEEFDCQDGIDNDGDGLIDYPDDPGCATPNDPRETTPIPALGAWGIGVLIALMLLLSDSHRNRAARHRA